jgi:uncharacterized protein (TIGR03435 family)
MLFAKMAGPLALAVLCGSMARAQSAPAFEAASLKPSGPDSSRGLSVTSTQWVWSRASLNQLIKAAFNVKDYSLSAPSWLDATEFDLVAKFPVDAPASQRTTMLQTLLLERFKLTYHFESKTANGYALVLAKDGLKVRPVDGGEQNGNVGPNLLKARNTSLAQLAGMLSVKLDRPIQDQTGTGGVFNFEMKWTPEAGPPQMTPGGPPEAAADPTGPSLFTALQEQLGLKLEARKVPVQVLVIDHAERTPTGN